MGLVDPPRLKQKKQRKSQTNNKWIIRSNGKGGERLAPDKPRSRGVPVKVGERENARISIKGIENTKQGTEARVEAGRGEGIRQKKNFQKGTPSTSQVTREAEGEKRHRGISRKVRGRV